MSWGIFILGLPMDYEKNCDGPIIKISLITSLMQPQNIGDMPYWIFTPAGGLRMRIHSTNNESGRKRHHKYVQTTLPCNLQADTTQPLPKTRPFNATLSVKEKIARYVCRMCVYSKTDARRDLPCGPHAVQII